LCKNDIFAQNYIMKKISIILIALLVSVIAQAQTWNGIKVGEKLQPTLNALVAKGFKPFTHSDEAYCHIYKNAKGEEAFIVYSPKTKVVCKIVVSVDKRPSWNGIKESYNKYKELLSKKYIFDNDDNEFTSPYHEGDGYELLALKSGNARVQTTYIVDNVGSIMLQVTAYSIYEGELSVHYQNDDAYLIYKKEKEEIQLNKL